MPATRSLHADLLVVGGGLGGVAAALAALHLGCTVILAEPTGWLGGQLTAQAVPLDEHPWVEHTGSSAGYRALRAKLRDYYRRAYPLTPAAQADATLNPGLGFVSPLCTEPRAGLAAIDELLAPYFTRGQLTLLLHHRPAAVAADGDRIAGVTLLDTQAGTTVTCTAAMYLDATELGDLLALGGVEHVIGAEAQADTGELHALPGAANPLDQQAITWCFALDFVPGADHTSDRPAAYEFWRTYQPPFWPDRLFSFTYPDPVTLRPRTLPLFDGEPQRRDGVDLWCYRRIFYRGHCLSGTFPSDITLVNWPQTDYFLGPLLGVTEAEQARHLAACRDLSLCFLYWLQTEAPRHDGGYGYPELRLRPAVVGGVGGSGSSTADALADGLARHVYIREARRIRAEFTVTEAHVGVEQRRHCRGAGLDRAAQFPDSVGLGSYRIDLHPSTAGRTYIDVSSYPFQVPLGALLPVRVDNLLPAAKNLGVTHITNSCYRLHPVEWAIGEAAGALGAFCVQRRLIPRQVRNTPALLADYQRLLTATLGVPLAWPDDIATTPR